MSTKRMKGKGPWLFTAALLFALLSCASGPIAYAHIDAGVRSGSYQSALAHLNNNTSRAWRNIYGARNEILFFLDRGMVHHYAGHYRESAEDLAIAERLIEEAFTKSISQEIASYVLNDNAKDYPGEDYEDLYINVFQSLNFYHNGDLESALVEIRRLNEKLNYLADKYERAKNKVLDENQQIDPQLLTEARLPMEASRFSNSALARYLGILFYRGTGRADSARVDYEELLRAYELAPDVYANRIPSSVHEELSVPAGMGRLNAIAFTGLSPVKVEENIVIPLPLPAPNNFARLPFPRMQNRAQSVQRAEAVLNTGERFALELIEDMGAVARETFKSKHGLTVLKTTARVIMKNAAGAGAAAAVAKNSDESLGYLMGLAMKAFTEASEQADTRLSRYFPNHALVGGINLAPGNYELTINFYGPGGLVFSESREISVRERALNLEEFVHLR